MCGDDVGEDVGDRNKKGELRKSLWHFARRPSNATYAAVPDQPKTIVACSRKW